MSHDYHPPKPSVPTEARMEQIREELKLNAENAQFWADQMREGLGLRNRKPNAKEQKALKDSLSFLRHAISSCELILTEGGR